MLTCTVMSLALRLVSIGGMARVNPTILMRTGDFAMELTVVNQDTERHMLYVDGLQVHSRVLDPGQREILTFYSRGEATYDYYDYGKQDEPLGQIQAVKVASSITKSEILKRHPR